MSNTYNMLRVGFIGLGHMGLPMALNLIKAGCSVTGADLSFTAREMFESNGGKSLEHLNSTADKYDVIITMLQTGQQVLNVCLGPQGLFENIKPGTLFIDCSTIDVESAKTVHKQAVLNGIQALDAPVSGGVAGAKAGSLTFMVGGEEANFERAHPLLSLMGQKIIYSGSAGTGQAAKICNNMILGVSMIAVSEAFFLARQLGLDDKKLFEVVTHASGQCWAISQYAPVPNVLPNVPANNAFKPGFTTAMMLKDLNLTQDAAEESGIKIPLAGLARAMYQTYSEKGGADQDFSGIIQSYEKVESKQLEN